MKTIGVIAPSLSGTDEMLAKLPAYQALLKPLGFQATLAPNIADIEALGSGSIESRLSDLYWGFESPGIDLVMSLIGGFNMNQLLPEIDWKRVAKSDRPFVGHSDLTIFSNALYATTGKSSFYGMNFRNFLQGDIPSEVTVDNFYTALSKNNLAEQSFFSQSWFSAIGDKTPIVDATPQVVIQSGEAQGVCLGGNVGTFFLLQGTPWMPSLEDPFVLIFEDDDMPGDDTLREFDRKLESVLQQTGASENIQGLLIGRFQEPSKVEFCKLAQVIRSKKALTGKPVVANLNFGHPSPRSLIPIGEKLSLEANVQAGSFKVSW